VTRGSGGSCTPVPVQAPDGSVRQQLGAPAPQVLARAVTPRDVRFDWRFQARPQQCEPALLALTVLPGDAKFTPLTEFVRVAAGSGTHTVRLPSFYVRSKMALASAFTRTGVRSPVVRVAIRD
jgi:hypothetical protein